MRKAIALSLSFMFLLTVSVRAQSPRPTSQTFENLTFRNLGGAIVSGRISDGAPRPLDQLAQRRAELVLGRAGLLHCRPCTTTSATNA